MSGFTFPKDSRKVVRAALRAGFTFTHKKGHGKLRAPNGEYVVTGSSISDRNGAKLLNRQIMELARKCGLPLEE